MKSKFRLISAIAVSLLGAVTIANFRPVAQAQTAAPALQRDVQYGEAGGEKLFLNIYGADPKQKRPAIILIHGGGWVAGSRNDLDLLGQGVSALGYVGFSVGYRFAKDGKNRFPAQLDDVQRAVRFVRAHATDYGIDPNKIGAMGFSAGGHLVSLLGTMDTRDNSDPALANYSSRVQCVVDVFGPTDFTAGLKVDPTITPGGANTQGDWLVNNFLGPLPEFATNYTLASPIKHIDKKTVPFLILHGAKDNLVPVAQSTSFDEALRKAGIESKLVVFPNGGHGFGPEDTNTTNQLAIEFFKRHLQGN
ncbi:alpha/beta hydrolase [bacterium]|nr:MAG: alpha/beta hydrolase [bacterium]